MDTVRGIVDHDTIRLVTPLSLPQGCEIEFEPRVVHAPKKESSDALHQLLRQSASTGIPDLAARHNEHQP